MTPTIGRIVHYALSQVDADLINKRRADFSATRSGPNGPPNTGHVAHFGNSAAAGDYCPAMVVRTWGGTRVNLQVYLDGNDTFWATSRAEGEGPGTWMWPPRVES